MLVDVVAVVLVLGSQAAARRQPLIPHDLDGLGYALLVLTACALAWLTRRPQLTLAAVLALVGAYLLIGYPYSPVLFAGSVAVFVVVDRSSTRQGGWVTLVALVVVAAPQLRWVDPANPLGYAAALLAECAGLVVPAALLAMIRQRTRQAISIASITVLTAITVISIFKPWGRTRRVPSATALTHRS